jgi:hypothetical protein
MCTSSVIGEGAGPQTIRLHTTIERFAVYHLSTRFLLSLKYFCNVDLIQAKNNQLSFVHINTQTYGGNI